MLCWVPKNPSWLCAIEFSCLSNICQREKQWRVFGKTSSMHGCLQGFVYISDYNLRCLPTHCSKPCFINQTSVDLDSSAINAQPSKIGWQWWFTPTKGAKGNFSWYFT
jgi:hypothetical protein